MGAKCHVRPVAGRRRALGAHCMPAALPPAAAPGPPPAHARPSPASPGLHPPLPDPCALAPPPRPVRPRRRASTRSVPARAALARGAAARPAGGKSRQAACSLQRCASARRGRPSPPRAGECESMLLPHTAAPPLACTSRCCLLPLPAYGNAPRRCFLRSVDNGCASRCKQAAPLPSAVQQRCAAGARQVSQGGPAPGRSQGVACCRRCAAPAASSGAAAAALPRCCAAAAAAVLLYC